MVSILFVCTGNICRSPMAEGLLRRLTKDVEGQVDVSSVGIVGWDGSGAEPEAVEAAAERGADISGHEARRLEPWHLGDADLILCMAAEHRDAVVELDPDSEGRTFTLKELVRLLERTPPLDEATEPEERLRSRIRKADELRSSGLQGARSEEDVTDPLGTSLDMFRAVAWDLDEWCTRLVAALFESANQAAV